MFDFKEFLVSNKNKVDDIKNVAEKIVIFGAGNTSRLYENCFIEECSKLAGFADNDLRKQGKYFLGGHKVVSLQDIKREYGENVLILISSAMDRVYWSIANQLDGMGYKYITADAYFFAKHINELLECYESFDDEESANLYADLIRYRIDRQRPKLPFPYGEAYFAKPDFVDFLGDEVFVDMGAFVGDTIERYIYLHQGYFGKIYAFEPDEKNFGAMKKRVERLKSEWGFEEDKIELIQAGVGKISSMQYIIQAGLGSCLTEYKSENVAENAVNVVALDDFFADQKVGFLKADIESFEYDMLLGAEQVIRRDHPKIAICIYHNASDMYRIMLWIKHLNQNYHFSLGHHTVFQGDTVLYAW